MHGSQAPSKYCVQTLTNITPHKTNNTVTLHEQCKYYTNNTLALHKQCKYYTNTASLLQAVQSLQDWNSKFHSLEYSGILSCKQLCCSLFWSQSSSNGTRQKDMQRQATVVTKGDFHQKLPNKFKFYLKKVIMT